MSEISEGIILPIPKTQQETDLYNSLRDYFLKITESINFTEPAAIGGTTPNTGAFTTLTSTGGAINGTIGATTPAAITGTTITANTAFAGALNGTVGATTPAAATFTLLTSTGGVVFPTSDPAVAGVWWDNAGTLTKSSG